MEGVVELIGIELTTCTLRTYRSSQLSYSPNYRKGCIIWSAARLFQLWRGEKEGATPGEMLLQNGVGENVDPERQRVLRAHSRTVRTLG